MGIWYGPGSGSDVDYKIVGGSTQPSSPAEKTIWVKTDAAITSHIFAADQPTGEAGMVWISTGTSSPAKMSVTKSNPVTVYPLNCKQFIGGAWVDKEALSYLNGAWVPWLVYLFKSGQGPTTGWTSYLNGGSVTIAEDKITFKGTGESYEMGCLLKRNERLDLTGISKLFFHVERLSGCTVLRCGVRETDPTAISQTMTAYENAASGESTLEVDVSSLTGMHTVTVYCGIAAYSGSNVAHVKDIYYS